MDSALNELLQTLQGEAVMSIELNSLLPELRKRNLVTHEEFYRLSVSRRSLNERKRSLLSIIQGKGEAGFDLFIKALQAERQHTTHGEFAEKLTKAKTIIRNRLAIIRRPKPPPRPPKKPNLQDIAPKVILNVGSTKQVNSEQQVLATSEYLYIQGQLRQITNSFGRKFDEMNAKLDTVQSAVQLLTHTMMTIQDKLGQTQQTSAVKESRGFCESFDDSSREYEYIDMDTDNENDYSHQQPSFNQADYVEMKMLAQAQSGEFWLAVNKANRSKVVVKKPRPSISSQILGREINCLKSCQHPNIIRFITANIDSTRNTYLLYFEYAEKGQLKTFLQNEKASLNTPLLFSMAAGVACGMVELERRKIVHCDLRANNILVDGDLVCKLASFSRAHCLKDTESYKVCNVFQLTTRWQAPEVLNGGKFSNQSDVWSFGVFLAEIFSYGGIPYPGMKANEVKSFVMGKKKMEKPPECPKEVYDLMKECFHYRSDQRLSFTSVYKALMQLHGNFFSKDWGRMAGEIED